MKNWKVLFAIGCGLIVAACGGGGSSDSGPIAVPPVVNAAPVASAGADQSVLANAVVTLDASKSSDANSDPLTYVWTLTTKPAGSAAALTNSTSAKPTFTADSAGAYVATLIVNDGKIDSSPDAVNVNVSVDNAAPVANAGAAQNVTTGTVVTLDGSASSDANSDPLTFAWTLTTKPAGSAATLSSATSAKPTFSADVAGTYAAGLVVNDGKVNSGNTATVSITAGGANVAPVANAGVSQNVVVGAIVTLDGSASSDANGDPLTYAWTLTAKPVGSTGNLSSGTSVKPTFTADVSGTYVVTLNVNDGKVNSSAVTVSITAVAANVAPVANAGVSQNVVTGAVVTLDGSGSSDANGDALTYRWTMISHPDFSQADITPLAHSTKPTFVADTTGTYEIWLTVNDGRLDSEHSTVTVTTTSGAPLTYEIESNNTSATANNITINSTMVGRLMAASDVDWFKIQLNAGLNYLDIRTQISNNSQVLNVSIYSPGMTPYSDDLFSLATGKTGIANGGIVAATSGEYLIRVQTPYLAPTLLYSGNYYISISR